MMQDIENNISWIEKLEVTGPIKSIMGFVDDLSLNYERRLSAMHADYQKDVEEIIACYKQEKEEFKTTAEKLEILIEKQEKEYKVLQQSYKTLTVAHKITEECLENTKAELAALTKELQSETELVKLAQERIRSANEQIKVEMQDNTAEPARTSKTREFFKLIMESRAARAVMLSKKKPNVNAAAESADQSNFSY